VAVLEEIEKADTSKETMKSPVGRQALAQLVEQIARLDAKAVDEMAAALGAMR
jgi:hypothetical protein